MSIFDGQRLTNASFKLDVERMRRGWYSDKYFQNIEGMLTALSADTNIGDTEVEMQWFTRRPGKTVVVGVDKALAMLRHCAGYFEGETFVETWDRLQVEAVHDGATVS